MKKKIHLTFCKKLFNMKKILLFSILTFMFFLISNYLFFGCCLFQLFYFISFFIIALLTSLYLILEEFKEIKRQYIIEQNLTIGNLSKKYKDNIEQMYDEHIFSITHELRSPLAVINSCSTETLNKIRNIYNEVYKLKCVNKDKFKIIKQRLNTINDQVYIIESFIANLGIYGSYISARSNDQFKITEVYPYLKSIIQNAPTFSRNMKIFNKNIKMNVEEDFKTIHTSLNSNDLTRILMNVFKNSADAIYYSQKELLEKNKNYIPEIKISCLKTLDQRNMILKNDIIGPFGTTRIENPMYLVIEDNGPGISKENQKKIFSYGFSTKSEKQNLGMGLHVSMQLAEKNDLSLFIKTNDHGTKFIIGFPNIIYLEKNDVNPKEGWKMNPKDVFISDSSKEIQKELVKSIL